MIAELVKENENYTYRIRSKSEVVLESRLYKRKISAVRGFKRFNNSVRLGRITICNDVGCYHIEIKDASNKVIAVSVNLDSKMSVNRFRTKIQKRAIVLKDIETNKMRTYIQNIGNIQLKEPLTVEISKEDDFVVSIPELYLFAYNRNLQEALEELKQDLARIYNRIFIDKVKVGGNASIIKNHLTKLIDA